ncbi:AfsR/SARP family transcriptional regulator [Micromonospora sp. LOL_015]
MTPQALKVRSLLAYLAVHSGRTVSTDQLIDTIWAGDPPRTALTALHVYVCRLRQHLKAAGLASDDLATRPPGYLLNLNQYAFDLRTFDELTTRAQQAESIGDLPGSATLLGEALALWQGPPLADLRDLPVLAATAHVITERRVATQERYFETALILRRHGYVVADLYRSVGEYPMSERLHYLLMLALYRSGRTAESLMVYNRLRANLVEGLGLEPNLLVQRLHRAILDRREWLDDPSYLHAS